MRSLFGLLSDDSSLFDFDFFDILAKSTLNSVDDVDLVSFEGKEVFSSSDFEFGDSLGVFLDVDGYIINELLFLAAFLDLSADLPSFNRLRNSLGFLIYLGLG